jgi:hypothetical protein
VRKQPVNFPAIENHELNTLRKNRLVILSEAKNLSSISVQEKKQGEILRFAQNDSVLCFSAAREVCATVQSCNE